MAAANNDLHAVLFTQHANHSLSFFTSCADFACMIALQEVEVLLLQHHHAAEPQNTTQQAGVFHTHSRYVWLQRYFHALTNNGIYDSCSTQRWQQPATLGWPAEAHPKSSTCLCNGASSKRGKT